MRRNLAYRRSFNKRLEMKERNSYASKISNILIIFYVIIRMFFRFTVIFSEKRHRQHR